MDKQIEIYQSGDGQTLVEVRFDQETVWLNRSQMASLFDRDIKTIGKHINNVFQEEELERDSVVANFATTANDGKTYQVEHYNLDLIISIGYRVKSKRGTQFRQWATGRLKDFLVKGYAINEKRLAQKQLEIQTLKEGIRILSRAIESQSTTSELNWLNQYAIGLELLDEYDHERLDERGLTKRETIYPALKQYFAVIESMKADFESPIFGRKRIRAFKALSPKLQKGLKAKIFTPQSKKKPPHCFIWS